MNYKQGLLLLLTVLGLSGCATMPTGPTVSVMPSPGKPFEVFMADDNVCREWAQRQIGGTSPSQTANENTASGAAIGTLVGAGLGALIGSTTGNVGAGAAIGAGAGLLGGTAVGSNAGAASGYDLQRRYDIAYQQCMYSKGNQIPGVQRQPARAYTPPPLHLRGRLPKRRCREASCLSIPAKARAKRNRRKILTSAKAGLWAKPATTRLSRRPTICLEIRGLR